MGHILFCQNTCTKCCTCFFELLLLVLPKKDSLTEETLKELWLGWPENSLHYWRPLFLRALLHLPGFNPSPHPRSWAKMIQSNCEGTLRGDNLIHSSFRYLIKPSQVLGLGSMKKHSKTIQIESEIFGIHVTITCLSFLLPNLLSNVPKVWSWRIVFSLPSTHHSAVSLCLLTYCSNDDCSTSARFNCQGHSLHI